METPDFRRRRGIPGLLLAFLTLSLAAMACGWVKDEETLAVNATPETFLLRGETTHYWYVVVTPGVEYGVTIDTLKPFWKRNVENYEIPVSVSACSIQSDLGCTEETTLAHSYSGYDKPRITFVGPDMGEVWIYVHDKIGESYNKVGWLTIMVQEYTSETQAEPAGAEAP